MKKKLVFFIGGMNFGGMERVVFIASELLKNNYEITIVTLYKTSADYNIGNNIYDLNVPPCSGKVNKVIQFFKRLYMTKKMKIELNPDIVYSFGMYSNYLNALTHKKEKIIMGIRSYDWLSKPFVTSKLDKYIVSKFDSINSVSELIAVDAERYWKIPQEENMVIYNPYNIDFIQKKAMENIDDFVFDKRCFYYITMGRLSYQKAFDHLLYAFSIVNKKYDNTRLIIMGNGENLGQLKKIRDSLNLKDKVFFIGGKNNPYKYVKKADVYVLSSYTEGFPNALVEAMCIGTPVVSVNCKSGPAEIFRYNKIKSKDSSSLFEICECGILTNEMIDESRTGRYQQSEISLAQGMIVLYENSDLRNRLRDNALKRVCDFDYDTFKEKMIYEIER